MVREALKYSVVVIGGGIVGSAAAFFLARSGNDLSVAVIDADSTYTHATSPQGAGGVRQQFSRPENIALSTWSLSFYKRFNQEMAGVPDLPDINFRQQGYLFVVSADGEATLCQNQELQASMGVHAQLLDRDELKRRFPSILRDDIALGCYTPDDGWIDPHAGLWGFRRGAMHHGAEYIEGRVNGIEVSKTKGTAVRLADGTVIHAEMIVNTAGPWVGEIAHMTGTELPVVPMCRVQHFWKCAENVEPLPLVKDGRGLFFRPEGAGFAGGRPSFDIEAGFVDDIYRGYFSNYFEETVWPMLAALVPKFEDLHLERSWFGHYAQNLLDGNMIIGSYSPGHDNIITACGFSGHGIMHAPAVGRALAEHVLHGSSQSIDLTRLEFERVRRDEPYAEIGIR